MSITFADIFLSEDAQTILKNKYLLFLGDSVICLEKSKNFKGEFYFENDVLLEGGQKGKMQNEINYTEVREYKTGFHYVKFYFLTRCYSDYLKSICDDLKRDSEKPDVVIMNSGCWDLTRYGSNSIYEYKQNLPYGIYSLSKVLPSYTIFVWTTTLPLSRDVKGGFMIPELEGTKSKLREDVLEANYYAANVIKEFKLDLIDLHFYFHKQIQRRAKDGIHWDSTAHRRISNLILNHICEAWNIETPGRILVKKNPDIFEPCNSNIGESDDFYNDDFNANFEENSNATRTPPPICKNIGTDDLPLELKNSIKRIKSNDIKYESLINNNHKSHENNYYNLNEKIGSNFNSQNSINNNYQCNADNFCNNINFQIGNQMGLQYQQQYQQQQQFTQMRNIGFFNNPFCIFQNQIDQQKNFLTNHNISNSTAILLPPLMTSFNNNIQYNSNKNNNYNTSNKLNNNYNNNKRKRNE